MGSARKADDLERIARGLIDLGFSLPLPHIRYHDVEQRCRGVAGGGDLYVFDHAEILEDPNVLERPAQAQPRDPMWLEGKDFIAVDANRAGIGMRCTAQRVEERGLARAVRPDDRLNDAAGDVEI